MKKNKNGLNTELLENGMTLQTNYDNGLKNGIEIYNGPIKDIPKPILKELKMKLYKYFNKTLFIQYAEHIDLLYYYINKCFNCI